MFQPARQLPWWDRLALASQRRCSSLNASMVRAWLQDSLHIYISHVSSVTLLSSMSADPQEGRVLLDGVDLRALSMSWLRKQMGLVAQVSLA